MKFISMIDNPYVAPQTLQNGESPAAGFRWRLIPVAIFASFGFMMLASGVLQLTMMAYWYFATSTDPHMNRTLSSRAIAPGIIATLFGLWLLMAARIGWKGRWKTAIAMAVVMYCMLAFAEVSGLM